MNFREQIKQLHKTLKEAFKFNVGDKVKITGHVDMKGSSGVIEQVSSKSGNYYLVNVRGKKGYYNEADLKLISRAESDAQLFNKGAKVKTQEGLVGTITKTLKENGKVLHWVNHQGPFTEKELMRG